MTATRHTPPSIALLVHSGNATWRRSMRAALHALFDAGHTAGAVTVLFSAREAEAAKCLADPRVGLALAVDEPAIRRTLSSLAPSLPVIWATASDETGALAARVGVALDTLRQNAQPGSSA